MSAIRTTMQNVQVGRSLYLKEEQAIERLSTLPRSRSFVLDP